MFHEANYERGKLKHENDDLKRQYSNLVGDVSKLFDWQETQVQEMKYERIT